MHHKQDGPEDPLVQMGLEAGYELRDINLKGLGVTTALFFVFAFACFAVVGVWLLIYKPKMGSELAPNKPMPTILLQSDSSVRADIATFRQKETVRLSSSGINLDRTYHIPVDQALDLIAQRGLPHTVTDTLATSPGNTIPQNAVGPGANAGMGLGVNADQAKRTPVGALPSGGAHANP